MSSSVAVRSAALGILLSTSAATSALFCILAALGRDLEFSCIPAGLAGGLNLFTLGAIVGHTWWPARIVPGIGISVSSISAISTVAAITFLSSQNRGSATFNSLFLVTIAISILAIVLQTALWTFAFVHSRLPAFVHGPSERQPRRSSIGTFGFSAYEMEAAAEREAIRDSRWNSLKAKVSPRLSTRKSFASSKTAVDRTNDEIIAPGPETMPTPSAFDNWDTTSVAVLNRAAVIASQRFSPPPQFGGLGIIDAPMPPPPRVFNSNIRNSKASTIVVPDWNGIDSITAIEVSQQEVDYHKQDHWETSTIPEVPSPVPSAEQIAQAVNEDESRTLQASEIASVLAYNAQMEREAEATRLAQQSSDNNN